MNANLQAYQIRNTAGEELKSVTPLFIIYDGSAPCSESFKPPHILVEALLRTVEAGFTLSLRSMVPPIDSFCRY